MQIIGVDPHKGSHTAAAVTAEGVVLDQLRVVSSKRQVDRLLGWAKCWPQRIWAVEGARGVGRLLAQQLVARGETVVDVPASLSTKVRLLSGGSGRKTDTADAVAAGLAAIHRQDLRQVVVEDQHQVMRLLSVRRGQLSSARTQAAVRLHVVLAELSAGGLTKRLSVTQASALLVKIRPVTAVDTLRKRLARDLLADIKRLDTQLKVNHADIEAAVAATGTTLMSVPGIGVLTAAKILAQTGPVHRFANRSHFASYAGVAPIDASSGEVCRHRLSRRGNRQLNAALHTVAITQTREHGQGRAFYDKKINEGKTKREARRALKTHLSHTIFAVMVADHEREQRSPGGQTGATPRSSAVDQSPTADTSEKSLPGLPIQAKPNAA
jgi:transposase